VKTDHPRAIDRYIDFFGDGTTTARADRGSRRSPRALIYRPNGVWSDQSSEK